MKKTLWQRLIEWFSAPVDQPVVPLNIIEEEVSLGANIDTRTDEERAKDIHFDEIVASANAVTWQEKSKDAWRKFPERNQGSKGFTCVANTMAKIAGILVWLKTGDYLAFSAADIYRRRTPKQEGMIGDDAFAIAQAGVTLEAVMPSEQLSDAQIDAIRPQQYTQDIAQIFKFGKQIVLPVADIESIASVINTTGKPVMVWFYFQQNEWSMFVPSIFNKSLDVHNALRHSVTAVDFTLYGGEKALVIEDSAWFGGFNRRVITETFFLKRNWYAAYPMNFKFDEPVGQKPTFVQGNTVSLQNCLKYEGVFPTNISSSGVYGSVTTQAVKDFQKKYGFEQTGVVGPKTMAKLQEIYI